MPYEQVRDILTTLREFHRELGRICEEISERTGDERVQLLMEIVRRHEKDFAAALEGCREETADGVLNTWVQFTPTEEIRRALQGARLADAESVGEVAEAVWEFEQALIALYRQLADSTAAPRVEELFERLLEREESKTGKYAWSLEEFQGGPIEGPPSDD